MKCQWCDNDAYHNVRVDDTWVALCCECWLLDGHCSNFNILLTGDCRKALVKLRLRCEEVFGPSPIRAER